jgi:hypothetical protein
LIRKRLLVAFVTGFLLLSTVSAALAVTDTNVGANLWFTPYDGGAYNSTNSSNKVHKVGFSGCKWNSTAVSTFNVSQAWELEFRYSPITNIFQNGTPLAYTNSLPGAYWEYTDLDDKSFGCHNPHQLVVGQSYSGYMTFTPASSQPSSFKWWIESEFGLDYGMYGDPIPTDFDFLNYLSRPTSANNTTSYTW